MLMILNPINPDIISFKRHKINKGSVHCNNMSNEDKRVVTSKGVRHVMKSLLDMPVGSHALLVYPDLATLRGIYKIHFFEFSQYVRIVGNIAIL